MKQVWEVKSGDKVRYCLKENTKKEFIGKVTKRSRLLAFIKPER